MNTFKLILIAIISLSFNSYNAYSQNTLIIQPDSVEGKDAHINSNFPDANEKDNHGFYSAGWTWNGDYGTVRSFMQFDLSSIPTNANIISAKLSLYNDRGNSFVLTDGEHASLTVSNASFLSKVLEAWDEGIINWNNQPNFDPNKQIILEESTNPNQDYVDLDVSEMIQEMVENPTENHGFVLRLQTEINYAALIFASSDNIDSDKHPKLEVEYSLTTHVEQQTEKLSPINVFPNPAKEEINIDLGNIESNVTATLFNSTGQMIATDNFISESLLTMKLDVPSGIYFLRLQTPVETIKKIKIIKE